MSNRTRTSLLAASLVAGVGLTVGACSDDVATTPGPGTCTDTCTDTCTGTGGAGPACPSGQTDCNGVCVVTDHDPANCGSCDNACTADQVCSIGQCATECLGGTTECGGMCVNTDFDPAHCGSCDNDCQAGEVCSMGDCGVECLGGSTLCGDLCVDTLVDPGNCGGCADDPNPGDNVCPADEICSAGTCQLSCPAPTEDCGGVCVNTQSDPVHCGFCSNVCAPDAACVGGDCVGFVAARYLYVANDVSPGSISGFGIGVNGALAPLAGSPYATGGSSAFNHHPDSIEICGDYLYAVNASSATIAGFTIAADGSLSALAGSPYSSGSNILSIACNFDNTLLFGSSFDDEVHRFSIAANGTLAALGQTAGAFSTLGQTYAPLSSRLFVASWSSTVNVFDVDENSGDLTAVAGSPFATDGSNHSASVSPDGSFVATEGQNNVRVWAVDANGALTAVPGAPFDDPTGCEVVGLVWAPDGQRLFVGHRSCSPGRVMVYDVAVDGSLTAVAGAPFATGGDDGVGLAIDPFGRNLFVAHRGGDVVGVLDIAPSGALTPVPGSPFDNQGVSGDQSWLVLR